MENSQLVYHFARETHGFPYVHRWQITGGCTGRATATSLDFDIL